MSNSMDQFLLSKVPNIANLQRTTAQTVEARIDDAIQRMQIAVSDAYDIVSVFSIYWSSDDSGGREDSSLFTKTLSKLPNVESCQRSLPDGVLNFTLSHEIAEAASQSESERRKLFILHYAGHAIASSTPDSLIIVPNVIEDDVPQIDISVIKNLLKDLATKSSGLDVLLVIDCCCAAIAGRGGKAKGARVELMAATAHKGISNSRQDGLTFTQHWCGAFTRLLEMGEPFNCDDIVKVITPNPGLDQFPATFVLREGWDIPITFRPRPIPIASTLPAAVTSRTVVTAFHIKEDSDSAPLKKLIKYLDTAPVKITVLAVLPTGSTLLLLRVPAFLQDLLVLPRIAFIIIDS